MTLSENGYFAGVNKREAIELIAGHADEIRSFGVDRLYLFGSTVRNKANRASDVDMFIDLRQGVRFSLFDLIDLRDYLSRLLNTKADVFPRQGLHRAIRRDVERNAVRVF